MNTKDDLNRISQILELPNSFGTPKDIPERVLELAAEMIIYLHFCPTKENVSLQKLLEKSSLKEILQGVKNNHQQF